MFDISLDEYKKHLIEFYYHECDNNEEKKKEREESVLRLGDKYLQDIIDNTISFSIYILKKMKEEKCAFDNSIFTSVYLDVDNPNSSIYTGCTGGYHPDIIYNVNLENKNISFSRYIFNQIFSECFIENDEELEDIEDIEDGIEVYGFYSYPKLTISMPINYFKEKCEKLNEYLDNEAKKYYFNHYIKHTYYIVLAWKCIRNILLDKNIITDEELNKINDLIAWHDNSKISEDEFIQYARKFYYGSFLTDEIRDDFKKAVEHHKKNNLHHFESLKNYEGDDWKCYIIELICDYIAMGWEFENFIFAYYESKKDKINLPKEYKEYLEYVLSILKTYCYSDIEKPLTEEKIRLLERM